jgi:hypothetical protein
MIENGRRNVFADPVQRRLALTAVIGLIFGCVWLLVPANILAGGPTIPTNPPMPPLHRHYLVMPNGSTVEVGPDWCDNQEDPAIKLAFYNFHWNVHKGALGLENGVETEIKGHPGCGPIPATATP